MAKSNVRVDWATHDAAAYACKKWHYTKTVPVGKLVKIGVWENDAFIGVVIFTWGANKDLGKPYGLQLTECCELVRVALSSHEVQVSRILAISLRFLKQSSPGLRMVVSFADPVQGHHGGIYQATNWIYAGTTEKSHEFRLNGKRLNKRAYTGHNFGKNRQELPAGSVRVELPGKHRYLMPLDCQMKIQVLPLAQPYPKRVSPERGAGVQPAKGGADPTLTLHPAEAGDASDGASNG